MSRRGLALARIIHDSSAAIADPLFRQAWPRASRGQPAGSPLGPSTYCMSTPQALRAPCAGLTTRLGDFATNTHE